MRLLSVLIFCYCCFHFLQLVVSSEEEDGLLAACAQGPICANLGNISYPFGANSSCGASPSFLLSNCSTEQAHWYNFNEASPNDTIGPPAVINISQYNSRSGGSVNLTWGTNLFTSNCLPAAYSEVSHYLPSSINLTAFADSAFQISPNNIYLLFNCLNLTSLASLNYIVEANSTICQSYLLQCIDLITLCFQLKPTKELMLQGIMESLACTDFHFFVTLDTSLPVTDWHAGMVQLNWIDSQLPSYSECVTCEKTNGTCGYDGDDFKCFCPGNQNSSTDCDQHVEHECNGLLCSKIAIVGIMAVSVAAIAILAVLALCCHRRRRKFSTTTIPISSSNKFWTERALGLSEKFGPVPTKEFSYEELLQATESFADKNKIGDGGFGAVYVGFLRDGRKAAIKRLYHDNFRRMEPFYNEMKILSKFQHPNLVKLYGFCCQDERDLLLVFEYASNGTVSDQLHDVNKPGMSWKVRLNIAWETAAGLSHLHNSLSPPIFHRDVKTTNILLDENFHAKVADFGLSRLVPLQVTHVSTTPQGTPGYVDPDYIQSHQLTDKSDVYSFGVVLMELVSGMLAVDMSRNTREINLSSLAIMKIACGAWEELVDPRLEMDKDQDMKRMVKGVVELAFQCLQPEKDDRPSMSLVAETLANIRTESGYGYEKVIKAQYSYKEDINAPSSADETSQLLKNKFAFNFAYSPNSMVWTSSNTSSDSMVWTSSNTPSDLSSL